MFMKVQKFGVVFQMKLIKLQIMLYIKNKKFA